MNNFSLVLEFLGENSHRNWVLWLLCFHLYLPFSNNYLMSNQTTNKTALNVLLMFTNRAFMGISFITSRSIISGKSKKGRYATNNSVIQ